MLLVFSIYRPISSLPVLESKDKFSHCPLRLFLVQGSFDGSVLNIVKPTFQQGYTPALLLMKIMTSNTKHQHTNKKEEIWYGWIYI